MGKVQYDAGILDENEELTSAPLDGEGNGGAKERFIQDVKDILAYGTADMNLICNEPQIAALPGAENIPLENEELYPQFHENVLGQYKTIAQKLNLEGGYAFTPLPILDPLTVPNINPPSWRFPEDFAAFFALPTIPKLAAAWQVPPVDIPSILAELPIQIPPEFPFDFGLDLDPDFYLDLLTFRLSFLQALPSLLVDLALQIPTLILELLALQFRTICELIADSGAFGPNPSEGAVLAASQIVMINKTVECTAILVVGKTLGSSPVGIVGGLGTNYHYRPPPIVEAEGGNFRNGIVNYAESADGLSYGSNREDYTMTLFPNMQRTSVEEGYSGPTQKAFNYASTASSCGLFVRGSLIMAGFRGKSSDAARGQPTNLDGDPYFVGEYDVGSAISHIVWLADHYRATRTINGRNHVPEMERGDIMLIGDETQGELAHVLIVTEDFNGGIGDNCGGIQGGTPDAQNRNRPTRIARSRFEFLSGELGQTRPQVRRWSEDFTATEQSEQPRRYVMRIINTEALYDAIEGGN
jgi:hypothetical protein